MSNGNTSSSSSSGGVGAVGLIWAVMLVFKLGGMAGTSWGVNFSWWWFALPPAISLGLVLAFLVLFFLIALVAVMWEGAGISRKKKSTRPGTTFRK